jgi:drug/metabolite transporter (DMT)-like permease
LVKVSRIEVSIVKKQSLRNSLLLLLTALIWGVAFVAQKDGMNYIEPFTYNGIRSLLGGVALLVILPVLDKLRARNGSFEKGSRKNIIVGGILCGVALFVASNLQQFGIALQAADTNVGKAGFITACYCAIVPILSLFLKKKSPLLVWLGVAVAVVGFFFLCLMDGLAAGQGLGLGLSDFLLLLCAVCFSIHILIIDHYSPLADGVRLSCIQFLVCGLLCLPCMFIWETPVWANIAACWLPIAYAGIMSCAVAYTLQIVGQKGVHPAVASLILSLESVFSVLAGYVLMPGSTLSGWELIGCVLVFAAVVMVQLAPQGEK